MAVAERFRMWTPAGRDDGQDILPRDFVMVGIWGLFVCERFVRFCSSGTDTASVRSNWRAAHGLRSGVQRSKMICHECKVIFQWRLCVFLRQRCHLAGLTVCLT
jgi:hypothetical protein